MLHTLLFNDVTIVVALDILIGMCLYASSDERETYMLQFQIGCAAKCVQQYAFMSMQSEVCYRNGKQKTEVTKKKVAKTYLLPQVFQGLQQQQQQQQQKRCRKQKANGTQRYKMRGACPIISGMRFVELSSTKLSSG